MSLFQGPMLPGVIALVSSWIPASERSLSMAIIWGGNRIATVATFGLCGWIAEEIGWEWDFYLFGILGLVVCSFWIFLCYNSPADHPRISAVSHSRAEQSESIFETKVYVGHLPFQEEKDYLIQDINENKSSDRKRLPVAPYGKILTSIPFLSMTFCNICMSWGTYTLVTEMPTYLNNVQHIPLTLVKRTIKPETGNHCSYVTFHFKVWPDAHY